MKWECGGGKWWSGGTKFGEAETSLKVKMGRLGRNEKMRNVNVGCFCLREIERVFPRVHRKMAEDSTTSVTESNVTYSQLCFMV